MNNKSEIFDFYMSCNGKLKKKKEEWLYLSENFEEKRGKIEKFKKKYMSPTSKIAVAILSDLFLMEAFKFFACESCFLHSFT